MKTSCRKSQFGKGLRRHRLLPAEGPAGLRNRVALFGAIACLAAMPVLADDPPPSVEVDMGTGDCGTAVIDGDPSEWLAEEGSFDFYSAMYTNGKPEQPGAQVLADFFMRHEGGTGYLLVLARPGFTMVEDANASWLRDYKLAHPLVPWNQGPAPVWVRNAQDQIIGYEASFPLPADGIWPAEVHAAVSAAGTTYQASTGDMTWKTIAINVPECKVGVGNLAWKEDPFNPNQTPGVFDPNFDVSLKGMTIWLDRIDTSVSEGTGPDRCDPSRADTDVIESTSVVSDPVSGLYLFDHVLPGTFRVRVGGDEFASGQLNNFNASSNFSANGEDDNVNHNAIPAATVAEAEQYGVCTARFAVTVGGAPARTGEPGPATTLPDSSVDRTRDLAFSGQEGEPGDIGSVGSVIFVDLNHNGKQDADEPGIEGVTVELSGGGLPSSKTTVTAADGTFLFRDLFPDRSYDLSVPASELAPNGKVSDALKKVYGDLGVSRVNVPAWTVSTQVNAGSAKVDGENKGSQSGTIDVTRNLGTHPNPAEATVPLTLYLEPTDGTGHAAYVESEIGMGQDNALALDPKFESDYTEAAMDQNGDMTADLGFVHACQVICDVNEDGKVTMSDITQITTWGRQNKRVDKTDLAHTGNCQQTGIISRNDAMYCSKLIAPNAK